MFYVTNCYTLVHREYMHACCCKKKNNFAIDLFVDNAVKIILGERELDIKTPILNMHVHIYGRAKVIESLYFCEDFIF